MKTIFAYTDQSALPASHQVGYVNLSEDDQGVATLTVRSEGEAGGCTACGQQHPASAQLPLSDVTLSQLAWAISQHLGRRDAGALPDFRARVVDECSEIKGRLSRLEAFMLTPTFYSLPGDEQQRMRSQFAAMCSYWSVLDERIRNFPDAPAPAADPIATEKTQ